jgi:hypothetical protein
MPPVFHHPRAVGMTYGEHVRFSIWLAWQFAVASAQAIVHAIYPDVYITSSTDAASRIAQRIRSRLE